MRGAGVAPIERRRPFPSTLAPAGGLRGRRLAGAAGPERRSPGVSDSVDLLIVAGTLGDGAGAPGRPGNVVVEGDRLRLLSADAPQPDAARTIDATGKVVAPGFIAPHSHGGLVILAVPRHEPKVRQGITTELVGVDGLSYAPFLDPADLQKLREMNAGLERAPGRRAVSAGLAGDPAGVAFDWSSVASYLDRLDVRSLNVATLVGNTPVRIAALGWGEPAGGGRRHPHTQRAAPRE